MGSIDKLFTVISHHVIKHRVMRAVKKMTEEQKTELLQLVNDNSDDERIRELFASVGMNIE